jgi:hypothetical protein
MGVEFYGGTVHLGIFVIICLYLLTVGGVAVFSFVKNRIASRLSGDERRGR